MKNRLFLLCTFFLFINIDDSFSQEINAKNHLSSKEITALYGNPEDADDIAFSYVYSEGIFSDPLKKNLLNYWTAIAAENDPTGRCQYNYYILIISEGYKLDDYRRGVYWLNKSICLGYKVPNSCIESDSCYKNEFDEEKFINPIKNESNLELYKEVALMGSGKAAYNLSLYYEKQHDQSQYMYWLQIGSQNGSKECMKEYAALLRKSSDKYDNIRAEFWEKKATS